MSATYQGGQPAGVNLFDDIVPASGSTWSVAASADVFPFYTGQPVFKHTNTAAEGDTNSGYLGATTLPGSQYAFSCYVWMPKGFSAADFSFRGDLLANLVAPQADQTRLAQWLRVAAAANAEQTYTPFVLGCITALGTLFYSTCWQLEPGSVCNPYVPAIGSPPGPPVIYPQSKLPLSDIALQWNNTITAADIAMNGPDLLADDGLNTAIILSLLTDRVAAPGDILPDPASLDRRGWWADAFLPPVGGKPDFMGSRLWLLRRAVQNNETLIRAKHYAAEALQWLLDDGVAGALDITPSYPAMGRMLITVSLMQAGSKRSFDIYWSFS